MRKSHSSSSEEFDSSLKHIPKRYIPQGILGKGACGVVIQCEDSKMKEIVAIKVSTSTVTLRNEISMLRKLNKRPFEDSFVKMLSAPWSEKYLVMEKLDMSFIDYVYENAPMKLEDIRTVIEQLAVALKYLKANHIIHTDIKLNNIMLVDHIRQPLKVKIIDFGLAMLDDEEIEGYIRPAYRYRAPEILLKLPISAAIDVWSLGCVLATMILGLSLFPGNAVYNQLYYMIELLGPPPEHMLKASAETYKYFKNKGCVFQAPSEKHKRKLRENRMYNLTSLDEIKTMRMEPDNCTEAEERSECIELLKSMLTWDQNERITPRDILKHPFITKSFLKTSHSSRSCRRHKAPNEEDPRCYPSTSFMAQPGSAGCSSALQDLSMMSSSEPSSETDKTSAESSSLEPRWPRRTCLLMRLIWRCLDCMCLQK